MAEKSIRETVGNLGDVMYALQGVVYALADNEDADLGLGEKTRDGLRQAQYELLRLAQEHVDTLQGIVSREAA